MWRRTRERCASVCTVEQFSFGGGSIVVRTGIILPARIELVVIQNGSEHRAVE